MAQISMGMVAKPMVIMVGKPTDGGHAAGVTGYAYGGPWWVLWVYLRWDGASVSGYAHGGYGGYGGYTYGGTARVSVGMQECVQVALWQCHPVTHWFPLLYASYHTIM